MQCVCVYVEGHLSATPSTTRGFTALAHDIVAWWDTATADAPITVNTSKRLREQILIALDGSSAGQLRAIRPSHRRGAQRAPLDDVLSIVESTDPASVRMAKVLALLNVYQKRRLVPSPVIDAPRALHWHVVDAAGVVLEEAVIQIPGPRSCAADTLVCELDDLLGRVAGHECALVVADAKQLQYLEALANTTSLSSCGTCVQLRKFLSKESLAPGLPHETLIRRSGRTPAVNRARTIWEVVDARGVVALVLGLSEVCAIPRQEIVDHGVRHRCHALVGSTPRRSACSRDARVHGGHVIEPTRKFIDRAMAVVDFKSLYPSIIAAENIGSDLGLPDILRNLMDRRANASSTRVARACKLLANSMYGQLASSTSSMYDPALANQITASGRRHLGMLVDHLQRAGGDVVYGDTDSCMVTFAAMGAEEACAAQIRVQVDAFNDALPDPMFVEVQDVFTRTLMLSKKKYIACATSGEVRFVGTLNTREGLAPAVRLAYEHFARCAMSEDIGVVMASAKIRKGCTRIEAASPEDLVMVTKLTSLDKGGSCAPHIELARQETMKEDGLAYTFSDSIEYVLCEPRKGDLRCKIEAVSVREPGRTLAHAPLVQMFRKAALAVVRARFGGEFAGEVESALAPPTIRAAGAMPAFSFTD